MKWDKVYAQVNHIEVEMKDGPMVPAVSFRMVAEIGGRAFMATHVVLKQDFDEFPQQFGFILDEMVEYIDKQAGKPLPTWGHWCHDQVPKRLPLNTPRCPDCGALNFGRR